MAVEGTLDLFKLPEILQLVAQQRKTGILTVQGQQDIVAISFLNGRIVAADSLNQTLEEGLARVLVGEGILRREDLARASAEHQEAGGRLLDLLVERGYVARPRLLEVLRLQIRRLVQQLLRWEEGDFKFYSGDEVSYEESLVPISVEEVLLHADEPAVEAPRLPPSQLSQPSRPPYSAPEPRTATNLAPAAIPAPAPATRPRLVPVPAPSVPAPMPRLPSPPLPSSTLPSSTAPLSKVVPPPAIPDLSTGAFRRMRVEEAAVPPSHRTAARLLALGAALLLAAVVLRLPDLLTLPFPWQDAQRSALASVQRSALFLKIDRAVKTFHLLGGSFPDRLAQLRAAGLLAAADLVDPEGQPLAYQAGTTSYSLEPLDDRGAPLPGLEVTESITGNFLLDQDLTNASPDAQVPLVLLD